MHQQGEVEQLGQKGHARCSFKGETPENTEVHNPPSLAVAGANEIYENHKPRRRENRGHSAPHSPRNPPIFICYESEGVVQGNQELDSPRYSVLHRLDRG